MNVVVTGGAGFIGSHLVEALLEQGARVRVIDDLSTGRIENLPSHPDLRLIKKPVQGCRTDDLAGAVDAVFHLAATSSVQQAWDEPMRVHENNLTATLSAIELARHMRCPRIVFSSSAAVYGNPASVPLTEDSPCAPVSPYGLQKHASERYLQLFATHHGFSAVVLRLFNVFGPRQDPRSPYSGVISRFVNEACRGNALRIDGSGEQTRDFVHVADVVNAMLAAQRLDLPAGGCAIFNIGTGGETSVNTLAGRVRHLTDTESAGIRRHATREGDIMRSFADISRARDDLGLVPGVSLTEGLRALIDQWRAAPPDKTLEDR